MTIRRIMQLVLLGVCVAPVWLIGGEQVQKDVQVPRTAEQYAGDPLELLGHHEVLGDAYVPVPREARITGPSARPAQGRYVSVQVNVDANGQNIVGDAANEPTIAVDPTDLTRMVVGWRQFDTITSDFRQAGWGYSHDGGLTWTFPGVIEPGHFRSDPVLDSDVNGNFYYNSLTNESGYQCKVFKSVDGGVTWDAGVFAQGGDKQWMTIDKSSSIGQGHIYASWNEFYSICSGHFTASRNGGLSFEACTSIPNSPYWGTLAVGPDGELFVNGGGGGFYVARSSTARNPSGTITWDFSVSMNMGGTVQYSVGPNPGGLLGQAWIAVDQSPGPSRGHVYQLCSVDPPGADPLDVMFSRSTNGGQTWSTPIRVNDDPVGGDAWQWFGTMSVAPNGRIDAIWNDSRGDPGGYDSAVYYSFSTDGGLTWSPNEAATPSFNPLVGWPQQNKIGDYYHMISDEGGASLAYSATFNGEQDVYFLRLGDPICPDAGTIRLDRPNYMCSGTAGLVVLDCGLNTDDSTIQTVSVAVDSTLETGVEQALLTETSAGSARFEGSIALSTSDAPGVLLVAEGNVITATYQDADDGTGTPATVQATALVDCTPPGISNVHTTSIEPRAAVVAFDATEPSQGIVHYGTNCGALNNFAVGSGYATSPTVSVGGLTDNTTYFYSVEAEDEAGNTALDDNGGSCYTFSTPEVPDFFTELFDSAANDLDNISLMFTPNGSNDFYAACAEPITALPTDPTGGTTLSMTDDSFATITIGGGQSVKLYGTSYTTIYPASNGYISLAAGESGYTESFATHFAAPRVAALFDDLNPASGGTVSWRQLSDRVAVTWLNVFEYGATSPNTFQIVMYFDGRLEINYLTVAVADGLAGLSAGGGVDPDFLESDLSALGACGPRPPTATNRAASTAVSVPVTVTLQATDDDLPDPPAALTYVVSSLPAHGSLSDPQAGSIDSVPYTLANRGDQVMYEPNSGYQGQDTFQYVANDGGTPPEGGDSNIGLVTITVGGAAWNPVAHSVSFGTAVSQAVNVVLNGTDPNSDPLTYVIETLPTAGYLQDPNGGEITAVPYTLLAGGHVVVYQPPCGEVISASFTYTVHDATAGSNVATAAVTVNSSGPRLVYNFPLDSNPGWTLDAAWAFGQPLGLGSHNHDPNAGHTGSTVYGYNLSGDYANNLPARYLTTTALNCSNMTATELRFWRWLAVERYDRARVEASNDGSNWVVLWENPTTTTLSETSWTQQIIDLSAVADGRSTVWVRWSMGPTDTSTTYPGWNLDDIEFWGIVPAVGSDFNGDGLVNATDLSLLVDCLQGPSELAAFECLCKDLDADGDVDLADFAQFQAAFGG